MTTPTKTPALLPTRELEPCPFCGGTDGDLVQGFTRATEDFAFWSVECVKCGAEIASDTSQAEADEHWNTRHSPAPDKGDEAHPDLAGHTADAVQDACRAHVGLIINSEIAVKIANDILAKQASVNAEYAALASPATPAGDSEGLRAALELSRLIVEADLHAAIEQGDADWEGMSRTALIAIDAAIAGPPSALATATPPEAVDAIPLAQPSGDAWKEAVLNELIVAHIYSAKHDNDPRLAIRDAIAWNVQVALDPAVSQAARDLQSGDAVLRETLERIASRLPGVRAPHRFSFACDIARRALASPPVEGEG